MGFDPKAVDVIIYHNLDCGTSRNALALIRNAGVEPHVIEYLKSPPSRELLIRRVHCMQVPLPQLGPFAKEDGEPIIDAQGRRVNAAKTRGVQ